MNYYRRGNQLHISIFVWCSLVIFAQSDVPRPRGVSLSKAALYPPTKDFTCFDGTITIPFSYVNDDYCDCFDGSDEPGTSACLNGVFHCTNAGHRPQNIPSSRVNDGVCDCCDGTDEYITEGLCWNTCEELGREARAEAARLTELHKAGSQIRLELIEKGNRKRAEMAEQLAQLEKDKADAEKVKSEKEALKDELEAKENEALKVYREAEEQERLKKAEEEKQATAQEASEHFELFDSDADGILTRDEIKVVQVFDKDKDGQVDEDEYRYFFNENENVDKETFLGITWPLLKPLLTMEDERFKAAEPEAQAEHVDEPHDVDIDENEPHKEEDIHKDEEGEELETDDVEDHEDVDDHEAVESSFRHYDDETQKLVDEATEARRQLTEAERTVREIESNMRNIKDNLDKDYGPQQVFATLDGQCFDYEDKEYIYKLCLFQKVTQQPKSGHAQVGLGDWGEWIGDSNNKYSAMKYMNGHNCWNGPNRMTTVNIQCGLETKLLSVTEPFRCEYNMVLSTPAACDESTVPQHTSHDEL